MQNNMSSDLLIQLHRELLRVRCAELALAERYKEQEMRTPTHFGVGQEAVAVGVCGALKTSDVAYSYHRSHNHFLAKGGSVYKLAAELFGRETGCSRGRGGSVHLTNRDTGFIASSAILGESIAAATGSALGFKMDKSSHISTAFFGDAVAEEGAFYECLSYASLKKLPVLFVCENNGYATESPLDIRQPDGAEISKRVESFQIPTRVLDGNDISEVYRTAKSLVDDIRGGGGPQFMECNTYRWLEHVGPHYDHELSRTYRTAEEVEAWKLKCPVKRSRENLIVTGIATDEECAEWEKSTQSQIEKDIEKAYGDPWPDVQDLFENVY